MVLDLNVMVLVLASSRLEREMERDAVLSFGKKGPAAATNSTNLDNDQRRGCTNQRMH